MISLFWNLDWDWKIKSLTFSICGFSSDLVETFLCITVFVSTFYTRPESDL